MQFNNAVLKDQAMGLRQQTQFHPIQVIAVTAGKGGVGKTNVSVNLAIALANQGKRVLLLDADLALANVDVLLGLHAKYNLSHVLKGECTLEDILLLGPGGIKIVPASSGTRMMSNLSATEHGGIINSFNTLADQVDMLLIDTAAGISNTVISFTQAAHEVIVVVCDEPTSLTDAYALIKVMSREHRISRFHILCNMTRTPQEGRELYAKLLRVSEHFLDVTLTYLGSLPYDDYLVKAVKKQKAVIEAYPSSKSAGQFAKLSSQVLSWSLPNDISGGMGFFLERLVQHATAERGAM